MFGNNSLFQQQQPQQQQGSLFGGQAAGGGSLFNQPAGGMNTQGGLFGGGQTGGGLFQQQGAQQGGLFNNPQQQPMQQQQLQFPQQNQQLFQQQQQVSLQQQQLNQRNEQDVMQMLKQHAQIITIQKEFSLMVNRIQKVAKEANTNLIAETQKLRDGKPVLIAGKTATSGVGINTPVVTEKKGISAESIEASGQNLEKIRQKNEVIFSKLFEIHCLIERIASNANTIVRESNQEMRLFRQFNDIDAQINQQSQKLIDLNQKVVDSKNSEESILEKQHSHSSSAREASSQNSLQNITKRKQVLIDMLSQMKKGIEIVREQHQEDSKDFEILIKKLNQTRTHPF